MPETSHILTKIHPVTPTDPAQSTDRLALEFDTGEKFTIPYFELRFECPCATCVDEITGKRSLKREQVRADIKPKAIEPVGRYGIKINWNDGHSTGMYHFDRLFEIGARSYKN